MAQLKRPSSGQVLISRLRVARDFAARAKGLLGTSDLPADEALWIHRCNSIHTFFMRYPIDCVFLDRNLVIRGLVANVRPGRVVWPRWGWSSVIEMRAGRIAELGLQRGEELHVGN